MRSPIGLSLLAVVALASGCMCKAISNHQWVGPKAPPIHSPEEVAMNLLTNVNGKVNGFGRTMGFVSTHFKRMGIMGWKDIGYDGEVTAVVKQTALSTDRFYTVDMKLLTLKVDEQDQRLDGDRYLRAEVCLCDVELKPEERPQVGEKVWMRGRIVWDGDGFIEIHPRNNTEVRKIAE